MVKIKLCASDLQGKLTLPDLNVLQNGFNAESNNPLLQNKK